MSIFLTACAKKAAGPVLTVCASGCEFRSVQNAVDQARPGDAVELQAGERFQEAVTIAGKRKLTLRTSRWKELPRPGYRIRPMEDASLLATIAAPGEDPALRIGSEGNIVSRNGVNLAEGTIRFEYAAKYASLREGAAVACMGELPSPLVVGKKYWVRDWSSWSRRGRLAETKDGPPLRFTSAGSSADENIYARPVCSLWEQPGDITVQGIRFEASHGKPTRNLVQVGHNTEPDPARMGPARIRFSHTVMTGERDYPGPLFCLALFGGVELSVADSWLGHCKMAGAESKGIAIQNARGVKVANNYVAAASINLMTGGGDAAGGKVNQDLEIVGNFFEKPGYMMYRQGPGAPSGPCYYGGGSGAYYWRTDTAAGYVCRPDRTWAFSPNEPKRTDNYLTKNLLELKDCENCLVRGNMLRGSFAGPDTGQGWCFGVSVGVSLPGSGFGGPYHHARHVTFRDNWADYCYSGVVIVNSRYDGVMFDQFPIEDVVVENNLFTHFGAFPELSQWPEANSMHRFGLKQSTGTRGIRFAANTFRGMGRWGIAVYQTFTEGPYSAITGAQYDGNILPFNDVSIGLDNATHDCSATGMFKYYPEDTARKRYRNNVFYGGALALLTTPGCTSTIAENNTYVADEAAAGNRFSAGADIDEVERLAAAAMKGEPARAAQKPHGALAYH